MKDEREITITVNEVDSLIFNGVVSALKIQVDDRHALKDAMRVTDHVMELITDIATKQAKSAAGRKAAQARYGNASTDIAADHARGMAQAMQQPGPAVVPPLAPVVPPYQAPPMQGPEGAFSAPPPVAQKRPGRPRKAAAPIEPLPTPPAAAVRVPAAAPGAPAAPAANPFAGTPAPAAEAALQQLFTPAPADPATAGLPSFLPRVPQGVILPPFGS